jgi:hypothetical protein
MRNDASQSFALKKMNKVQLIQQGAVEHLWCERDIMQRSHASEWLTRLYHAFEDGDSIYLAMVCDIHNILNETTHSKG